MAGMFFFPLSIIPIYLLGPNRCYFLKRTFLNSNWGSLSSILSYSMIFHDNTFHHLQCYILSVFIYFLIAFLTRCKCYNDRDHVCLVNCFISCLAEHMTYFKVLNQYCWINKVIGWNVTDILSSHLIANKNLLLL
jgi:hypothetical protein